MGTFRRVFEPIVIAYEDYFLVISVLLQILTHPFL